MFQDDFTRLNKETVLHGVNLYAMKCKVHPVNFLMAKQNATSYGNCLCTLMNVIISVSLPITVPDAVEIG